MSSMIKDRMDRKNELRKREKVVELIEIDGKKVSITSTGKRKFHNKSKNGCDNCKRRRVKCDEGKPLCQKCVNMKLDCVYTPTQPKRRRGSTVVKYVTKRAPGGREERVPASEAAGHSSDDSSCGSSRSNSRLPHPTPEEITTHVDFQERRIFGGIPSRTTPPAATATPALPSAGAVTASGFGTASTGAPTANAAVAQQLPQPQQMPLQTSQQLPQRQQHKNMGSPDKNFSTTTGNKGVLDGLLLPPLGSENSHLTPQQQQQQLQQQLLLLPQLMTLSNSEKYAAFEMPNSPPLQPTAMNITNSIGSIFSPNRFQQHQQQSHQQIQQPVQQPVQPPVQPPALPSFQAESIAQLNKASMNLKTMGMFPTAGIGGVTYDFQELLGIKYPGSSQASKASNAEEALANMQEQQEKATKGEGDGTGDQEAATSAENESSAVHMLATPSLPNNPTISPAAPITPMTKSSINAAAAATSPSVSAVPGTTTALPRNDRTDQPHVQEQDSSQNDQTNSLVVNLLQLSREGNLNLVDLKLFHHYCTKVWPSITAAGISGREVWSTEIPELAFQYPFLMHSLLAFSATHLSRAEPGLESYVSSHRLDALRLLRQAVLQISEDNTDALVASALILIMDSLANASNQSSANPNSMSPSAWIFHVKGAATILTAVWPLTEKSRFYNLISVDLSDLGDVINQDSATISELVCFDESIADLYPVEIDSPYLITLAYLDKLHREKNQSDFILRVFAFPALLDKTFLALLMTGDPGAMRIMRSYYKLLRGFTTEMKDKIWFLEGVSQVLPQDVDEYSGGGGMHMMLDFLGGGLPSMTTTNLSEFM